MLWVISGRARRTATLTANLVLGQSVNHTSGIVTMCQIWSMAASKTLTFPFLSQQIWRQIAWNNWMKTWSHIWLYGEIFKVGKAKRLLVRTQEVIEVLKTNLESMENFQWSPRPRILISLEQFTQNRRNSLLFMRSKVDYLRCQKSRSNEMRLDCIWLHWLDRLRVGEWLEDRISLAILHRQANLYYLQFRKWQEANIKRYRHFLNACHYCFFSIHLSILMCGTETVR